ncbi:MAG: anaerobic ribonucleoside-triphosphate reductase, partial [Desulfovibrio sp.]
CSSDLYTRVVGYYRPVSRWNKGKQEEYRERQEYSQQSFCPAN